VEISDDSVSPCGAGCVEMSENFQSDDGNHCSGFRAVSQLRAVLYGNDDIRKMQMLQNAIMVSVNDCGFSRFEIENRYLWGNRSATTEKKSGGQHHASTRFEAGNALTTSSIRKSAGTKFSRHSPDIIQLFIYNQNASHVALFQIQNRGQASQNRSDRHSRF
jgi:hypothetical protein